MSRRASYGKPLNRVLAVGAFLIAGVGAGIAGATQGGLSPGLGGIVGGLGGLVGSVMVDRRTERQAVGRALRELVPQRLDITGTWNMPLSFLRARGCPVLFRGRTAEGNALGEWLADEHAPAVFVVDGPAGIGKTRLVMEFARQRGEPWVCGWLRSEDTARLASVAKDADRPVLALVDDAEERDDLIGLLAALAAEGGPPPVRLLVTVRDAGLWLRQISRSRDEQASSVVESARVLSLSPQGSVDDRARWFSEAVAAFSMTRNPKVDPPHVPGYLRGPGHEENAPVVLLVAHALAVFLDVAKQGGPVSVRDSPSLDVLLGQLLAEEKLYWHAVADRPEHRLMVSEPARERAMAALVLLGADSEEEAVAVLSRVPDLRDVGADELGKLVRWANALYPGPRRFTPALGPQLIAGWFLADQLRTSPTLLRAMRTDLTRDQAAHALGWLGYAADHMPQGVAVFLDVVASDLFHLAPAAVAALSGSARTRGQLEEQLGHLIAQAQWSEEDLDRLELVLPPGLMRGVHVGVRYARVDYVRRNGSRADLAGSLIDLGVWFSGLGRPADALPSALEALTICRELAQANPDRYRPDLADSLSNLGAMFLELGRPADALPPIQEALTICRELAQANPDRYRPDLADSLSNLGAMFLGLGRPADALPSALEALTICRELAQANPGRYRPDLAGSLNNLGVLFAELGRPADALPPTQEALTIRRELAQANPDRYRPDLADSLNNLGVRFAELGRPADALPPTQEAITIYRELAQANPDRYRPGLATSLSNLGNWFSGLGRPADALLPAQEALTIRRELAQANPDRYRPDLADSLNNLGNRFAELGLPDALPPTQEALTIRRELAQANPDRYRPDLAGSLNNLGAMFAKLGLPADALPPTQEALTIRRELAQANPDRHRPDLADSLSNLGAMFLGLGRPADALPPTLEALTIYRALAQQAPNRFRRTYESLAGRLTGLRMEIEKPSRPSQ
ncbi:tetratricopeptide repeat protein [Sphaerisporangium perillae]|uniref:tetratricopeptide repeat protein n=1 Tax=Sphaerisporangium perillae TaxID=2935860 RepID=UPI0024359E20|nr:tetratricopeptide repeat protein [Sphaerisporangium perillae]